MLRFVLGAIVLTTLVNLGLAGCSGDADEGSPPARAPGDFSDRGVEDAPSRGDDDVDDLSTLVIAVKTVPQALDPLGDLDPWAHRIVDDVLFEGLVREDPDQAPFARPQLADRCVAVPQREPREVYCHLRDGAVFHNGEPVTSQDVDYSLNYWLDPRRGALRMRHGLTELKKIELVDRPQGVGEARTVPARDRRGPKRWVRIVFAQPEPLALERIAAMKIVPAAKRRLRSESFARAPVGSGPMKVVTMEPERLTLERVGTSDSTGVARIVFRKVADGAEALTLLRRGEVHIAAELAAAHVPAELTKPGMDARFVAYLRTPAHYDLLFYNLRRGALGGEQLRAALDRALPRQALASARNMPAWPIQAPIDLHEPTPIDLQALGTLGVSATWGVAGLPAATPSDDDPQRLDAVRSVLDGLGWVLDRGVRRRAGATLRLVLMWSDGPGRASQVADAVRDAWRDVGIRVPYAKASWGYIVGLLRKGEFDVALARLALPANADLHPYFHSRGPLNISGVADATLDDALEAYRAATDQGGRTTARRRIAQRIQALGPVSVLYAPTAVLLASRRVKNLGFVDDLPRLDPLGLSRESNWIETDRPVSASR